MIFGIELFKGVNDSKNYLRVIDRFVFVKSQIAFLIFLSLAVNLYFALSIRMSWTNDIKNVIGNTICEALNDLKKILFLNCSIM